MSYVFHDYETFNLSPLGGAPSQYAAIRTSKDFAIQSTENFFCLASEDTMPEIHACLVTKQTPNSIKSSGNALVEYDFVRKIHNILLEQPKTVVVGYNSLRFDDEWNRHLFYRNLFPAYDWHFKNGNSRYDAILLMQATYALRPHLLNWHYVPVKEGSDQMRVSMKLEDIAKVNGITHENAHDALSDVYALISLMQKIKEADPEFFETALQVNNKHHVSAMLQKNDNQNGLLYISPFESEHNFVGYVIPLFPSSTDNNVFWAWDAKVNPESILSLDDEVKSKLLSLKKDDLEALNLSKKGLVKISLNKLPNLFEKEVYKREFAADGSLNELRQTISDNIYSVKSCLTKIKELVALVESSAPTYADRTDADMGLYSSGFMSKSESSFVTQFAKLNNWQSRYDLIRNEAPTNRISKLGMRIVGRNSPEILDKADKELWDLYLNSRFIGAVDNTPVIDGFPMSSISQVEFLEKYIANVMPDSVDFQITTELIEYYKTKTPSEEFIAILSENLTDSLQLLDDLGSDLF
ncbi:exodeoxyribonuclease I [Vibrio coralliirubri]|uniref:exodeoxyribonuclease I n=1 Tax=Vibrio coralliirubri TaxID=1516159 RepID=UPI0022834B53|nr:exodeoxyribonuclease I [Vibrio coralliirubri]MCY9861047.1 exodeoxyribonuclease I [Vibrio coralliirubri]